MITRSLFLLAFALLPSLGAAQAPDNCELLRAQIEANIAAKGVTGFALSVVAADATVAGEVVGTCGNGARKIVYAKGAAPAQAAAPVSARPAAAWRNRRWHSAVRIRMAARPGARGHRRGMPRRARRSGRAAGCHRVGRAGAAAGYLGSAAGPVLAQPCRCFTTQSLASRPRK